MAGVVHESRSRLYIKGAFLALEKMFFKLIA